MTDYFPVMLAGFAAVVGITPITRRLAFHYGVLDQPSTRKVHQSPTPLLGGLAIYSALVLALVFFSPPFYLVEFGAIMAGTTWLVLLGLVDDRNGMRPWVKLGGQGVAGIVLILAGIQIHAFDSEALNIGLTLFWIVGITNAMNFQDNMDGLAAGITAVASTFFFVMAAREDLTLVSSLAAALAGASVGFLIYNFNPASTFMGDMGSMVLGFLLAVLAIKLDFNATIDRQAVTSAVPLVVLGFPIFDTSLVVFTRLRERRSPMLGGKDHTSHRLVSLGLSQRAAVLVLYGICVMLGFVAVQLSQATVRDATRIGAALVLTALIAFAFMEWTFISRKQ